MTTRSFLIFFTATLLTACEPTAQETSYAVEADVAAIKQLQTNWNAAVEAGDVDGYAAVLGKMYETPEWEAVRARNGWVNIYKPRAEFVTFLEGQEEAMKALLNGLGIETVR